MSLFLPILALLIAVLALAYAWKLQQELDKATSRLDRYNRAIFQNSDELRKLREALDEQTAATRVQWMKMTGGQFTADTTVREAQLLHPQAGQILAGYGPAHRSRAERHFAAAIAGQSQSVGGGGR
jgi:hypothetical protein